MGKVVGAISMSLVLASAGAAYAQEIGIVSTLPNVATGELIVDVPARPDGEKVYIVRNGTLVTEATIKSSGGQAGTIVSLPAGSAELVKTGDRLSLSPTLADPLPASAYDVKPGDVLPPSPGQQQLAKSASTVVTRTETTVEQGAPEPPVVVSAPAPAASSVELVSTAQLDKEGGKITRRTEVTAITANPTPRGMGVPVFPAPARVVTEAGVVAPYGQGLAAAAPVGTPYLRSPAFAGPPIIYMPQTVTRVLLPGATPYPSNIMSPPAQYSYSSAPFLRTDIYTSLPYGTFYWPQGYAGTTPVEPQVPAYVTAPASAIMSTEADYSAGRYVPGVANQETLNPITSGINANLVASTTLSPDGGNAATVATAPQAMPSLTVAQPGLEAGPSAEAVVGTPAAVNPFPVLGDTSVAVSATDTSVVAPGATPTLPSLPEMPAMAAPTPALALGTPAPTPSADVSGLPSLPTAVPGAAPAGLPALPAAPAPGAAGLPTLPAAPAPAAAGLPSLPAATGTPASMLPSLPTPQTPQAPATEIIVDDSAPGALTLDPADAWVASAASATDAHQGGALTATVDPAQVKTATFNATIPADGRYEVSLYYTGVPQFRSNAVPVTINTATGPQSATVDQTQTGQWHVVGTYDLKAGQNVPVVTLSTQGITGAGSGTSVTVDALKLTPQQ